MASLCEGVRGHAPVFVVCASLPTTVETLPKSKDR